MGILIAASLCIAITIGLAIVSVTPQKSILLEQLESVTARNISGPVHERFAAMEKIFGDDGRTQMQQQLVEAGWYTTTPAQIGARIGAGLAIGLAVGILPLFFLHPFKMLYLLIPFMPAIIGSYLPFFMLNQAIKSRKVAVQKALPDFLDMVGTTVQAGVALNQALSYAIPVAAGPLAEEVKECLSQVRLGRSLSDALRAMARRINQEQITSTITAITQAEKLGANISRVLNELAEEVRNARVTAVEEKAAALPITMVFPMVLFLLPALFSTIFGAVAAEILPTYFPWVRG